MRATTYHTGLAICWAALSPWLGGKLMKAMADVIELALLAFFVWMTATIIYQNWPQ